MNPEIKTKWIAALRSGEYKQGQGCLYSNDRFCCLGVLCDLHAIETGGKWLSESYLGDSVYPVAPVKRWAGLDHQNPLCGERRLANWNDQGKSFAEIADLIEQYL